MSVTVAISLVGSGWTIHKTLPLTGDDAGGWSGTTSDDTDNYSVNVFYLPVTGNFTTEIAVWIPSFGTGDGLQEDKLGTLWKSFNSATDRVDPLNPSQGTGVGTITLSGYTHTPVIVPCLQVWDWGLTETEARSLIAEAGLMVGTVSYITGEGTERVGFGLQSPGAGDTVDLGSSVDFTISRPGPSIPPKAINPVPITGRKNLNHSTKELTWEL